MNMDFRVSVDFFTHHKTKKLMKRLGNDGVLALLQLWAYIAKARPNGNLFGMTIEDIELAASWIGEDGKLIKNLIEAKFIDETPNGLILHDWIEHNPWVAGSDDRSDTSRLAKLKQANKAAYEELQRCGITSITKEEYQQWKDYVATPNQGSGKVVANVSKPSINANESLSTTQGNTGGTLGIPQGIPNNSPAFATGPSPSPSPIPVLKTKDIAQPAVAPPIAEEVSEPTKNHKAVKPVAYPEAFLRFWEVYPRLADQQRAFEVWKRIQAPEHERVITAARNYAAEMRRLGTEVEFIRFPKTFLNKGGWEDWVTGPPRISGAGVDGITDAEKNAIKAKYTNEEGQRDNRAILREIRALERERGIFRK